MSSFKKDYPEFAAIEHHIRRARAERAVAIASFLANAIIAITRAIGGKLQPTPPAATARLRRPLVVKARVSTART